MTEIFHVKRFAIVACLLLAGCDDTGARVYPSPDAKDCTDFHRLTYYEHDGSWEAWYGPITRNICIVRDVKIERGDDSNK